MNFVKPHQRIAALTLAAVISTGVLTITIFAQAPAAPQEVDPAKAYIERKLRKTIIPKIEFEKATLDEALLFFRKKSAELDPIEKDPEKKGIGFVLKKGAASPDARITLHLSDVPLSEALRQVTKLTSTQAKIELFGVVIEKKQHAPPLKAPPARQPARTKP